MELPGLDGFYKFHAVPVEALVVGVDVGNLEGARWKHIYPVVEGHSPTVLVPGHLAIKVQIRFFHKSVR